MAMKKPNVPVEGNGVGSPSRWSDEQFRREYPLLTAYLEDDTWDDGATRETSTLLVFVENGVLKGCFNDRAMSRSVFVSSGSLAGLLEALECGLQDNSLDWRAKQQFKKRK